MLVEIKEKSVYGNVLLYPCNECASILSELIGKKTFHNSDIELIKLLGHEVKIYKLY
jgi:hypothetical protein